MNNRKTLTVAFIILSLVALAVGTIWIGNNRPVEPAASRPVESTQEQRPAKGRTEISYAAKPGITSLEQLRQEARDVVTQQSEYGEYVDSIEGHKGGDGGNYWSFYVDGAMSEVGAGSYTQKGGEEIVWKFQKL